MHVETPQLSHDILARGQFRDTLFPFLEHIVLPQRVGTDSDWPAKVVEDNEVIWVFPRKVGHFRNLRVVTPRLKTEIVLGELCKSLTELIVHQYAWVRRCPVVLDLGTGVPGHADTNSLEPSPSQFDVLFQDVAHRLTNG